MYVSAKAGVERTFGEQVAAVRVPAVQLDVPKRVNPVPPQRDRAEI